MIAPMFGCTSHIINNLDAFCVCDMQLWCWCKSVYQRIWERIPWQRKSCSVWPIATTRSLLSGSQTGGPWFQRAEFSTTPDYTEERWVDEETGSRGDRGTMSRRGDRVAVNARLYVLFAKRDKTNSLLKSHWSSRSGTVPHVSCTVWLTLRGGWVCCAPGIDGPGTQTVWMWPSVDVNPGEQHVDQPVRLR